MWGHPQQQRAVFRWWDLQPEVGHHDGSCSSGEEKGSRCMFVCLNGLLVQTRAKFLFVSRRKKSDIRCMRHHLYTDMKVRKDLLIETNTHANISPKLWLYCKTEKWCETCASSTSSPLNMNATTIPLEILKKEAMKCQRCLHGVWILAWTVP